jgi:hypothetical protein
MLAELVRQSSGGTEMYRTRQPRPPRSVDLVARLGRQVQKFLWPPDAQRLPAGSLIIIARGSAAAARGTARARDCRAHQPAHGQRACDCSAASSLRESRRVPCLCSSPLLSSLFYFTPPYARPCDAMLSPSDAFTARVNRLRLAR